MMFAKEKSNGLWVTLLLSLTGCAQELEDPGPPYRAEVIVLSGVDPNTKQAQYRIENRELRQLESLRHLESAYLKLIYGGELYIQQIAGSQIQADKFTNGKDPILRYRVKDGVIIPSDYTTLALISAYYQFEQSFEKMEGLTGISPNTLLQASGGAKFQVMFEPRIRLDLNGGDSTIVQTYKLNAAYVSGQRQFVLFQRSPVERIPLSANFQVISHEFGHALFEHLFFNNDFDATNRFEKEYAIKGLNEGFSDFLSYSMTGSTDVLRGSVDILSKADERDFGRKYFSYRDIGDEKVCSGKFYCIGTIFAKALLDSTNALASLGVTQEQFLQAVATSMQKSKTEMEGLAAGILPEPNAADGKEAQFDAVYDGKVAGAFFHALIKNLPETWKPVVCTHFSSESNFGAVGFPRESRPPECIQTR